MRLRLAHRPGLEGIQQRGVALRADSAEFGGGAIGLAGDSGGDPLPRGAVQIRKYAGAGTGEQCRPERCAAAALDAEHARLKAVGLELIPRCALLPAAGDPDFPDREAGAQRADGVAIERVFERDSLEQGPEECRGRGGPIQVDPTTAQLRPGG